jgi:hypothetical protein
MNGSASRPSSATMNGTRCAIRPATKATSRDRRSSFETKTQHFAALAQARGGRELWPPVDRVGALAGLGLDELGDDRDAFGLGEAGDGRALRLDPEPRALLLLCGDTVVGNSAIHTKGIPPFALCMEPLSEQ